MKTRMIKIFFSTIAGVLFLLTMLPLAGYTEVPGRINYQGYLTDLDGNPVPDGNVEMEFAIYDELIDGTELWDEAQTVPVANGVYNVLLGQAIPLSPDLFRKYSELYFEVRIWNSDIADFETLKPRQPFTSTAFTMKAADADTLTGYEAGDFVSHGEADSIKSGMIQNSTIIAADLAANSVYSNEIAANAVGASEIATGAVGTSEIADGSVTATDLATNSVGASEIAADAVGASEIKWSLIHSGADLNGGLIGVINTSDGTSDNYPAGLNGGANGNPTNSPVIGVLGATPGLGHGSPVNMLPDDKIGVAGASTEHGVAGVSTSHHHAAIYGENTKGYGVYGMHTDPSYTAPAVYGNNTGSGSGVYGKTSNDSGKGVIGKATNTGDVQNYGGWFQSSGEDGRGVYGYASNEESTTNYGGYFEAKGGNGIGVYGLSTDYWGVYGYGGSRGVYGYATGSTGRGVYGYAVGSSAYGVYGYCYSGTGVYGYSYNGYAGHFNGDVKIDGNLEIYNGTTKVMELGTGLDYAEGFDVSEEAGINPGCVLIIDPDNPGKLALSKTAYDTKVAGIAAGANGLGSGVRLGGEAFDQDVALAGRVYCNVDATKVGVAPGDMLTTSSIPGYAMKSTDNMRAHGAILGKAMQGLEKGRNGQILVLVTLQ